MKLILYTGSVGKDSYNLNLTFDSFQVQETDTEHKYQDWALRDRHETESTYVLHSLIDLGEPGPSHS